MHVSINFFAPETKLCGYSSIFFVVITFIRGQGTEEWRLTRTTLFFLPNLMEVMTPRSLSRKFSRIGPKAALN